MVNAISRVLANRINQRSHITKITEVEENVTQFIGGNLITTSTQYPNWLLYLGHQNTLPTYHVKCHGRFVWSFWRIHGYLTREIYLGKRRSHYWIQFPVVKEQFTTVKVTRVTAPQYHPQFFSLREIRWKYSKLKDLANKPLTVIWLLHVGSI